jgi:hypothetical protein
MKVRAKMTEPLADLYRQLREYQGLSYAQVAHRLGRTETWQLPEEHAAECPACQERLRSATAPRGLVVDLGGTEKVAGT